MRIRPIYIQLIGDAAIPVLGFFFWEWSLYFILLFYILDLIVAEVFIHFKIKRIFNEQESDVSKNKWLFMGATGLLILLLNIVLFHTGVLFLHPEINFSMEFFNFLSYKELGLPQGVLLIPLVAFMGYQQYRMEFILTGKFKVASFTQVWADHMIARIWILLVAGVISLMVWKYTFVPEWVILIGIVLGSALYQLIGAFSTKPAR